MTSDLSPILTAISLQALCEKYLESLATRNAEPAGLAKRLFDEFVRGTPLAEVDARAVSSRDIAQLLRPLVVSRPHLAKRLRQHLHAAYGVALGWGDSHHDYEHFGIERDPTAGLSPISLPRPVARTVLNIDQLRGVAHALEAAVAASNSIALHALRCSLLLGGQQTLELLRCSVADVDVTTMEVTLWRRSGLGCTRPHKIPLTDKAAEEIRRLRDRAVLMDKKMLFGTHLGGRDRPVSAAAFTRAVSQLSGRSALEGQRPHFTHADLRRSIECWLHYSGVDPQTLAALYARRSSDPTYYERHPTWLTARVRRALLMLEVALVA